MLFSDVDNNNLKPLYSKNYLFQMIDVTRKLAADHIMLINKITDLC